MTEERLSEFGDISIEISKTKEQREKRLKRIEWNIQGLLNNYKRCKICKIEIQKEKTKRKEREKF